MNPRVALHGFTGGPASFDGLGLAFDLCPFGAGHGPLPYAEVESFDAEVARIVQLLREKLREPAQLTGYSMGGRLALAVALAAPELVCELNLIGANPGLDSASERAARKEWEQGWINMLLRDGLELFESNWSQMPLFSSQSGLTEEQRAAQKALRLSHSPEGLAHSLAVIGLGSMPNLWPRLTGLSVPTRCIVGALDAKFGAIAEQMLALNPRIECQRVANVGHNPLLEAPHEIRRLLERAPNTR